MSRFGITFLSLAIVASFAMGATQRPEVMPTPPIVGRWNLTVHSPGADYPSWLEVKHSGYTTLVGYFVGRGGSVRPISQVFFTKDQIKWTLPRQWEWERPGKGDLEFEGKLVGDRLEGTTTDDTGKPCKWSAVRAPSLKRASVPEWGEPLELFNGMDLNGWTSSPAGARSGWRARDGVLQNARPGTNLVTTGKFMDLKLHAEFRCPAGSNSGIYLRGRYEVQIEDRFGAEPSAYGCGGVYGFLKPRVNATRKAGEWQTFDITLVGREITVVHNGEEIIHRQEIPGPTGGALDNHESEPGPIYLQGDHGPVEFRKLTLTPGK